MADQREHLLIQATVEPVDEDGVVIGAVGTVAFAVATLVCWLMLDRLTAAGYADWLWICLTGTVVGVIGTAYCFRRSRSLH